MSQLDKREFLVRTGKVGRTFEELLSGSHYNHGSSTYGQFRDLTKHTELPQMTIGLEEGREGTSLEWRLLV